MTKLNRLRKIDWQYLVNRKEALLFSSTTDSPYGHRKFKKATNLNWQANFTMRFSDGDLFQDAKDMTALSSIFIKGGIKTLINFRQRLIFKIKNFDKLARQIEKHYKFPCDIEWAVAGGKIYITQSRPITTLKKIIAGFPLTRE